MKTSVPPPFPFQVEDQKRLRKMAGCYLRDLRIIAGLTQLEQANKLKVKNYTMLSQYESGKCALPSRLLIPFAKATRTDRHMFAKTALLYYQPYVFRILFPKEFSRMRKQIGI